MTLFGFSVTHMCGGPYRRGAPVRHVPGGLVIDWFGIGVWRSA